MLTNATNLPRRLHKLFLNLSTNRVYYVTDASNWIFEWIGYYVTTHLKKQHKVSARVMNDPVGLRNQIIHFIDRYSYLNGTFRRLHPSNQIFLTWFHGNPADPNPAMQQLFATLPEALESIQKVVVSCQISRQTLIEFGIPASQLVTIPLGVDLSRFTPSTTELRLRARTHLGIPKDAICIGSFQKDGVGWGDGNEPKLLKGPDIFLEVIAKLAGRYSNLLVLLTGPARGYVKQGLNKLGVPYIHQFLSNYHDIVQYYQALDLYIIPARCEGGPAALLESWATGVPIVSTSVGMPADLIKSGHNGMLAEVENVEGLTESAKTLIEDVAMREQCRRQALKNVQRYNWPLIAEHYHQLYQPFLHNGK